MPPENWTHPLIQGIVQQDGGHDGKAAQFSAELKAEVVLQVLTGVGFEGQWLAQQLAPGEVK